MSKAGKEQWPREPWHELSEHTIWQRSEGTAGVQDRVQDGGQQWMDQNLTCLAFSPSAPGSDLVHRLVNADGE